MYQKLLFLFVGILLQNTKWSHNTLEKKNNLSDLQSEICLVLFLWLNLGQFFCLLKPLIPTCTSVRGADYTDYVAIFKDWELCRQQWF